MALLVAAEKVPVVLMHMQATPQTMQAEPRYTDVLREVQDFLAFQVRFAIEAGVDRGKIIFDPRLGFGKNPQHKPTILRGPPTPPPPGKTPPVRAARQTLIWKIL